MGPDAKCPVAKFIRYRFEILFAFLYAKIIKFMKASYFIATEAVAARLEMQILILFCFTPADEFNFSWFIVLRVVYVNNFLRARSASDFLG